MNTTHGEHLEEFRLYLMELVGKEFESKTQAILKRSEAAEFKDDGPRDCPNARRVLREARQEIRQLYQETESLRDTLVSMIRETRRPPPA